MKHGILLALKIIGLTVCFFAFADYIWPWIDANLSLSTKITLACMVVALFLAYDFGYLRMRVNDLQSQVNGLEYEIEILKGKLQGLGHLAYKTRPKDDGEWHKSPTPRDIAPK